MAIKGAIIGDILGSHSMSLDVRRSGLEECSSADSLGPQF